MVYIVNIYDMMVKKTRKVCLWLLKFGRIHQKYDITGGNEHEQVH